jgi:hypothetical protein
MKKYNGFIAMYLVNVLLIWGANMLFPANFVLGSANNSTWGAILVVALLWDVLVWFTQPLLRKFKVELKKPMSIAAAYLVANFLVLWVLARLGPVFGFGVSSFVWVFALALVANLVQYAVWTVLAKLKLATM